MRLLSTNPEPVTSLPYRQARRGGGTEHVLLPVERLRVDAVPAGCDAVLVTSDLQGVAPSPFGGPPVLLGVAFAEHLRIWADAGLIPAPERLGVVLAGDLYSAPTADVRGASGAVDDVWLAFAAAGCPLVLGVAGNHDVIPPGGLGDLGPGTELLDGTWTDAGGVRFAGVGGVIGDPRRADRRAERPHLDGIAAVLKQDPDVLVLHEGPAGPQQAQHGNARIGATIAERPPPLTICGHVHWHRPVARLAGAHVLNVDSRAVLLTP